MKPLLVAVPHDWACVGPIVSSVVGKTFSRVVHGNSSEAVLAEKHSTEDIVLLIGGSGSHEVMKEMLSWRDVAGHQRVKWVHSYWTGVDAYRLDALKESFGQVPFTNARSTFAPMLAEHVLMSTMYFTRRVPLLQTNRKAKVYDRFPCIPGADIKLGIIGYGDIGRHVAKSAIHGLHVKEVMGLKTRPSTDSHDDLGVKLLAGPQGLDEILTTCDVVTAILPNTPHTKHMIRREHFQRMKPTAIFVNIGRGATVVEDDLVDALNAGEIHGAAIDVFEIEPLPPTSRLWEVDDSKLLLTPHNADINPHSYADAVQEFVEYSNNYVANGVLPEYRVDLNRGY